MARTESTMETLGTIAPNFSLPDVISGRQVQLQDLKGAPALLVMFICRHCPFVKHIEGELTRLAQDYLPQGVAIAAISANDAEQYPDDAPEQLQAYGQGLGWQFPLLYDETQAIAKAYRAACTPDFFLFDGDQRLVYRGQLDDSRPGNGQPVTGQDLRQALDLLLAGTPIPPEQKPSIGCNIKWKPGNAPDYFG